MTEDRLALLLELVVLQSAPGLSLPARVCFASVEAISITGAALALVSHNGHGGTVAATNARISRINDRQFTLGEGPVVDAYTTGEIVNEPDLTTPRATLQWPAFAFDAQQSGIAAAFGFPLSFGAKPVGALCLYRDTPAPMSGAELADASSLAVIATMVVIATQAQVATPEDSLHPQIEAGAGPAVVHQATGMAMAQLGVTIAEASVVLRAHAFAQDRPLADVAADVVAHRLRLQ